MDPQTPVTPPTPNQVPNPSPNPAPMTPTVVPEITSNPAFTPAPTPSPQVEPVPSIPNPAPTPSLPPAQGQSFASVPAPAAVPPSPTTPGQTTVPGHAPMTVENGKPKVFTAIKDVFNGIKRNPGATLVPLLLGYAASVVLIMLTSAISVAILAFSFSFSLWLLVGFVVLAVVAQIAVQTAFSSAYILALKESNEGTHHSLGTYLQRGFQVFGKVFLATLLLFVYMCAPLLLAIVFATVGSLVESLRTVMNLLAFVVGFGTIIWMFVAVIRYNLYWQVALFESNVTAKQTLSRSRELIKGRGEWFIVRASLLLIGVSLIINAISGGNINSSEPAQTNWLSLILSVILIPFMFGVPTMLYLYLSGNKKQSEPTQSQSQPMAPPEAPAL